MEVCVPTAPVGDLGEGVGGQDVLPKFRDGEASITLGLLNNRLQCLFKQFLSVYMNVLTMST